MPATPLIPSPTPTRPDAVALGISAPRQRNTPRNSIDTARCAHCGLTVPKGLLREGATEQFCCHGCETAYATIRSCGLDRFYDLRDERTAGATKPSTAARSYAEFDDAVFRELYVKGRAGRGGTCSVDLLLQNVHCSACLWLIERLPQATKGVLEARVNMRRAMVTVTWDDDAVSLSKIARTLDALGYPPHPARDVKAREKQAQEDRKQLVRIAVAGACAGNVMLMAICLYAGLFQGIDRATEQFFRWMSLGLTALCLAWPGAVFFRSAWGAIRTRTPHLDVPITLALAAGALWSLYTTILGKGEVYFDSLSVLVFVLLSGRFVQQRQQRHASDSVELLFSLTPPSARVIDGDALECGGVESTTVPTREVPVQALQVGQVVEVRAGESFPVDGHVVRGTSSVDQSLLTGESRPVPVQPGVTVLAGAVNISGPLLVCVGAAGEATRVGKLMRMVEECSQRRAPIVRMADRLSGVFVVGMLSLAAVAFVVWLVINPSRALDTSVALLVVTCPCALGLATPLTLTVALGRAAQRGILVKGGDAIQSLASPREGVKSADAPGGIMLLDKTGTLTMGRLSLVDFMGDASAKPLVRALEAHSSHPLAIALARDLASNTDGSGEPGSDTLRVTDIRQVIGGGITGTVDGRAVIVGSPEFVRSQAQVNDALFSYAQHAAGEGQTPVAIAVDGRWVAIAALGDSIRPDARTALDRVRRLGWSLAILSGDHPGVVASVARQLGIDDARGGLSPEDKLAVVQQITAEGRPVVFVGDGVNDAAALAAARVGIAVHGGAEASLSAADVYLHEQGLGSLVELLEGSRRTINIIKRNLALSFVYNVLAVAGTLAGFVTPLLAALIMPMSSITVLTVSFRSRTFDTRRGESAGPSAAGATTTGPRTAGRVTSEGGAL